MGFIKEAKAESIATAARRAANEGHSVFAVQLRGAVSHSPKLSRPIQDTAEMIEAIERQGWRLDKMDSFPYDNNVTLVCLFRRAVEAP